MHALTAVFLASILLFDAAFASSVQCNASYTWYAWATNSDGQDPCQLLTSLRDSCAHNADPLQPLSYVPSGMNFYPGPNSSVQNTCTCSYTMYNIMSACGDCQVGLSAPVAWPSYRDWSESCDPINIGGIYPDALPEDLTDSIPEWARFSTKDTGDPRWSYGLSKGVAVGHFFVNTKLVPTAHATCSSNISPALPIGTAFAGFVVGLLIAFLTFYLHHKRRSHVIPPPTRYHTAPDNTPLHPLVPRSAHAQGTSFLRRMLEHEQENDPRRIEPFDINAAVASFPPHPAVFPAMRAHTFPPILTVAAPSQGSHGPSRQPSLASLNPNVFAYQSPLRHSRSQSYSKSGSRPQTAASQFSTSAVAGPSNLVHLHNLSPTVSEPPSPLPPDPATWPDVPEDPPAYRRKS